MRPQRKEFKAREGEQNIFRTVSAGRMSKSYNVVGNILFLLSSYPSYIVEVFMRKRFGERYFSFSIAIIIAAIMLYPYLFMGKFMRMQLGFSWLVFILIFLYKSIRHRMEFSRHGTHYNFDMFSYSDGEIFPFFFNLIGTRILGIEVTKYRIFTLFEPAIPISTGLFLALIPITRPVGIIIFLSGILYCYRNTMKAHVARGLVLDVIDEQLVAKYKNDVIMEEKPKRNTRGLSFPIELPNSDSIRKRMVDSIEEENPLDIWDDE